MRNAFEHLVAALIGAGISAEIAPLLVWGAIGLLAFSIFLLYLYRVRRGQVEEESSLDTFLLSWRWIALTLGALFLLKALLVGVALLGFPIADTREFFLDLICVACLGLLLFRWHRSRKGFSADASPKDEYAHDGRWWFAIASLLLLVSSTVASPWRIVGDPITQEIREDQYVIGNRLRWGIRLPLVGRVVSFKPPQLEELIVFRDPIDVDRIRFGKIIGVAGDKNPHASETESRLNTVAASDNSGSVVPSKSVLVATDPSMNEKPFVIPYKNIFASVAYVIDSPFGFRSSGEIHD